MTLKCVAIDDEPLALELMKTYASRVQGLHLVSVFEDAISAVEYLNQSTVDLLFLDINMPDISGIELAKALINKPLIIFTTAYKQFAYEGFQLEAIDYLLKPIDFASFSKAVEKAISYKSYLERQIENSENTAIYVHSEYRLVKILLQEIEYIESMEDYVKIYHGKEKPTLTLMTLKKLLQMLPDQQFVRIHRSYVVNTSKIKEIRSRKVQLQTVQLPIGDSFANQLGLK